MKKLIIISAIALILATYYAVASTANYVDSPPVAVQEVTKQQEVTKPTPIVGSPVRKTVIFTGVVNVTEIAAGPVLKSDPPLLGSHDWLAQEKAAKDKIISIAEQKQAELEAKISQLENIVSNTKKLNETLELVKNQIGKTPWVFAGSSPRAWDCSGLVRWTYAQLGVDLRHSASVQRNSGTIVTEPKVGDLVSFNYRSYGSAYHIGRY
jgi:cell wall-associated NlpC family hydrolase